MPATRDFSSLKGQGSETGPVIGDQNSDEKKRKEEKGV